MAFADEYHTGHVATEDHYDPSWPTPTWAQLGNMVYSNNVTDFYFTPLGKLGSDRRAMGSTSNHVSASDVTSILRKTAMDAMRKGEISGSINDEGDVFAAMALVQHDPAYSAEMAYELANFKGAPIAHLTGFAIKAIR